MCVASMIHDHFSDKWRDLLTRPTPSVPGGIPYVPPVPAVSPAEVGEFRRLLERAREYDRRNNEPPCDDAGKKRLVKELAERLGVDVSFVDEGGSPS